MRIINKTKMGTVSFSGITVGGVFMYGNDVYMKIEAPSDVDNTVNLLNGKVGYTTGTIMVIPVEPELHIS